MERFNPFSVDLEHDPFTTSFNRSSESHQAAAAAAASEVTNRSQAQAPTSSQPEQSSAGASASVASPSRYSTSFPDPFGELPIAAAAAAAASDEPGNRATESPSRVAAGGSSRPGGSSRAPITSTVSDRPIQMSAAGNRSNSVTFAPMSHSVDDISSPPSGPQTRPTGRRHEPGGGGGGGLSSFLSRATSVTSSTVTDRVSGAVGSVRSAVDSLSSQLQQAVPSNLNERLSSNFMSGGGASDSLVQAQPQQPQQSTASYLASKLSSATGQFSAAAGAQSPNSMPVISRQRVVLILDSLADTDWAQQFSSYRRLVAGLGPAATTGGQSTLSSFFSQATAQLSSSAGAATGGGGGGAGGSAAAAAALDSDLIEQVDFRDISVLANQSTSTATVMVRSQHSSANYQQHSSGQLAQQAASQPTSLHQQLSRTNSQSLGRLANQAAGFRLIRPEYVVVRQRTKDRRDQLGSIVNALNYCLVPMFEPPEIWSVFQDRQLLFSKLLRIQRTLGRENFPLIPQCFCQTQQDLLNYINSSSVVSLPCLVRIGPTGQGKIRIDNQQMFRDFSTIMASSGLSCTVEPFLDVKCDLIIQKFGTSLKSFKKSVKRAPQPPASGQPGQQQQQPASAGAVDSDFGPYSAADFRSNASDFGMLPSRQSASRQTSLGSSVLSSLMQSATSSAQQQQQQQQQLARRSSNPAALAYEKVTEVNVRYRAWLEAIEREFDNKIEALCIKVVVASNDREYIVGLADCGMDFLGTLDNQDEDKRSFVELIISHMNTNLPKSGSNLISRESSLNPAAASNESSAGAGAGANASRSDDKAAAAAAAELMRLNLGGSGGGGEKKKFASQTQIDGDSSRSGLGNRSQSVSVNQSDFLKGENLINKSPGYFNRRGSDRSDSLTDTEAGSMGASMGGPANSAAGLHQRQASLGQSFFDQTSTALSSFQKQSMSFFKRFDAQSPQSASGGGGGPASGPASGAATPHSVKPERSFPMSTTGVAGAAAAAAAGATGAAAKGGNGFKSQSVDSSSFEFGTKPAGARKSPPKPPPPPSAQSLMNRQSSLASYSTLRGSPTATTTPSSTRVQTRQNSATSDGSQAQRNRVVRQNSALSAFEPYDPDLSRQHAEAEAPAGQQQPEAPVKKSQHVQQETAAKRSANYDSASLTSGDSTSTSETGTGEDTMNNLKKTFASIFGDKCD